MGGSSTHAQIEHTDNLDINVFELDVDPRIGTTKATCNLREIGLSAHNMVTILSSVEQCTRLGDLCDQMKILTFDIKYDINMSAENHEGNDYGYNVDLLILMY